MVQERKRPAGNMALYGLHMREREEVLAMSNCRIYICLSTRVELKATKGRHEGERDTKACDS